ncbi:hypothetical protein OEZ85_007847 [Tetradesmus obliquus]|uniref:Uncharacterized protein n=2 Tax=Tetradesmus obliquus TaxID=3088 RepID=A0ABY8TH54_TETOB|nr:hypothetical protein OEZ85_007847 [Tetradesmus obliquus]|eukprot:jgi/Sobl393_1/11529/SZX66947.1
MMLTGKTPTVRLAGSRTARPAVTRPVRPVLPCRAHNKDEYKDNPLYAKEAAGAAGNAASRGAEEVKDALVDTGDRLKEAAGETGEAIKHGVKAAGENVKEGVEQAQEPRVDSGVHDTWESTQDAAKGTAKDVKKAAEGLGDRISGH